MRRLIRIIRNIALLLIAAILVLAGVLAFNVLTRSSQQLQVAVVPRAAVDQPGAAARLSEAIRFRTISSFENPDQSSDAFRGLQAHILKSFPAFHAAAKRELIAQYSLLYKWEGSDAKAPPDRTARPPGRGAGRAGTENDWQQPPFDGVIADGFIWGRGSW